MTISCWITILRLYSRRRSNSSNSSSNNKKLQQTHSHDKYVNGDTLLHKNEFARKPCYSHTIDAKIWMVPKDQWLGHDTKQCRCLETINCQLFGNPNGTNQDSTSAAFSWITRLFGFALVWGSGNGVWGSDGIDVPYLCTMK